MQGYVSILEATKLTGKHKDTIRRLVKQNKSSTNIVSSKKGYLINKDWLLSNYELTPDKTTHTEAPQAVFTPQDEPIPTSDNTVTVPLIEALTNQLAAKDDQINKLQALLSEKEANTTKLQDQFQHLLARQTLPATVDDNTVTATYTEPEQVAQPESVTEQEPKPAAKKPQAKKQPKKKKQSKAKQPTKAVKAEAPKRKRFFGFNR